MPRTRCTLLRTTASSLIFASRASSKNSSGYIGSSGRLLPRRDLGRVFVDDFADELTRYIHTVHPGDVALDLADHHAAGVHGGDLLIEAGERRSWLPMICGSKLPRGRAARSR